MQPATTSPESTTLSLDITRKLTRRIVDEVYPPGSKLPTERDLSAEFGVTRHVVREALKRLEALGLVRIRQGSGILVEHLPLTGGTELFGSLLRRDDGSVDGAFLKDLLEFRAHMGETVVRLAARNRSDEDLAELQALVAARRNVLDDIARLNENNARLFQVVARATHNRIYQLVFNTFGQLFVQIRPNLKVHPENVVRFQQTLEQIVEAIGQRDEEMAVLLARRHAKMVYRGMAEFVQAVGEPLPWDEAAEDPIAGLESE